MASKIDLQELINPFANPLLICVSTYINPDFVSTEKAAEWVRQESLLWLDPTYSDLV